MTVTSPVFGQDNIIPRQYTCHGRGDRPPIYWSGAPSGTKALALVVDDADAPITPYIYWIVLDISPATTDIQTGPLPPGAHQADNSRGFAGYDAPCPIHGSHKYRFTVYAMSASLRSLGDDASVKAAWTAIARNAIARGRLTATANGLPNH
jgi:Raf kinase inhibitor-like YbhB/YbcL family protein